MLDKSREFNRLELFAQAFFAVMTQKLKEGEHWATLDYVLNIVKQLPNDYSVLRHSFSFISSNAASTRGFLDDLAERLYIIDDTFDKCYQEFTPLSDVCMGFYKSGDVEAVTNFFWRLKNRDVRFSA